MTDLLSDWVPVLAPPSLAARFMREVAAHLELAGGFDGPRDWDAASAAERRLFFRAATARQWTLLARLADSELPVPAAERARSLDTGVPDVAGIVGPLNKRAKQMGWVSPVRPQKFWRGRSAEKGLVVHPALVTWIKSNYDLVKDTQ